MLCVSARGTRALTLPPQAWARAGGGGRPARRQRILLLRLGSPGASSGACRVLCRTTSSARPRPSSGRSPWPPSGTSPSRSATAARRAVCGPSKSGCSSGGCSTRSMTRGGDANKRESSAKGKPGEAASKGRSKGKRRRPCLPAGYQSRSAACYQYQAWRV